MEQVVAGQVGLVTIKKLGQKGHTTWSNLVNIISNLLWSLDTGQRGTIVSQIIMSMVSWPRINAAEHDSILAIIIQFWTFCSTGSSQARRSRGDDIQTGYIQACSKDTSEHPE
jgi:hypothetical protein|eukprot:COSAG02_NODE_559_length_20335_cov_10.631894_22_plen_113_part_00